MQVMILTRLVRDLGFDTKLIIVATVRELSGLALSSRNVYMSNEDRELAGIVYRSLCAGKEVYRNSVECGELISAQKIKDAVLYSLFTEPNVKKVAYLDIFCCISGRVFDGDDLVPLNKDKSFDLKLAVSPFVGQTRLVDVVTL